MINVNLYNYRQRRVMARKNRLYLFIGLAVILAVIVNFGLLLMYSIKEIEQNSTNQAIENEVFFMNNKLSIVRDYDQKLVITNKKIQDAKLIAAEKNILFNILQILNKITPDQITLSSLTINNNTMDIKGSALSPLYLSSLMDELGNNYIFINPELNLNSNTGSDNKFALSAKINQEFEANLHESN